jgi:hypothetical protein
MAEETQLSSEPRRFAETDHEIVPAVVVEEARAVSGIAVDRRARLALELAAFAVERSVEGAHDALTLGRQLRLVADACTEATVLAHGLIDRAGASGA